MAQMVEQSSDVQEIASSILWYGNIGLCAQRQHLGSHALRQHSCILPREVIMIEPMYAVS